MSVMSVMEVGHIAYGEEGERFYSKNAKGTGLIVPMATPMVLSTLENIKFQKGNRPFVICDYGTADGGNSLSLIRDIIKCIKLKYGDSQPVHVIYEDQPCNDFKSLFATVQGPQSSLQDFKEVYVTASGTNFFNQCFPAETVHLGLSFTAMHWLSKRPCNLTDALFNKDNKHQDENELFKEQAAKDWEGLLLNRAKELAHGGELILVFGGTDKNGYYIGKGDNIKKSVVQVISELWKSMITEEEFINTTFNEYYRTEGEARAPFESAESAVSKAGLRLVESKVIVLKCPYYKEWQASEKTRADAESYAKKVVLAQRCWMSSTLMHGLSVKRTTQEKQMLVDECFQRSENMIAATPADHFFTYVEICLHIRKV